MAKNLFVISNLAKKKNPDTIQLYPIPDFTFKMENVEGRTEFTESTHNTKVSDSAYSNSCSNSQSQRR
jgi:hypothetical protein